jgi:hypothetical protein
VTSDDIIIIIITITLAPPFINLTLRATVSALAVDQTPDQPQVRPHYY